MVDYRPDIGDIIGLNPGQFKQKTKIFSVGTQHIIANRIVWFQDAVMGPNHKAEMANTVDPDQTAPLGAV